MSIITVTSILISFCAFFSYINYRLFKLPTTIGVMVMAIILSTIILCLPIMGIDLRPQARHILNGIDFSEALLHGMLSFLLFAGALHINITDLLEQKYIISIMAFLGTLFSTAMVGVVAYYLFPMIGFNIPFIYALIFGSLISPTDPVAVMAILKKAGVPATLEIKVVGESLFNDGIAVVVFVALLGIASKGHVMFSHISMLFVEEAFGGILLGLILGYITFLMLRSVDNYQVEILLTLSLVMGGYELARVLHTSGPITMVIAGLIIGNSGRRLAMSEKTRENLDNFWELVDEFLNAVLFLLIGFEILVIPFNPNALKVGLIMIPSLLIIRFFSVSLPILALKHTRSFSKGAIKILTWGGLRGGISVALVLSLPSGKIRDFLLVVTYLIVLFSIIVQGLTIEKLVRLVDKNG